MMPSASGRGRDSDRPTPKPGQRHWTSAASIKLSQVDGSGEEWGTQHSNGEEAGPQVNEFRRVLKKPGGRGRKKRNPASPETQVQTIQQRSLEPPCPPLTHSLWRAQQEECPRRNVTCATHSLNAAPTLS